MMPKILNINSVIAISESHTFNSSDTDWSTETREDLPYPIDFAINDNVLACDLFLKELSIDFSLECFGDLYLNVDYSADIEAAVYCALYDVDDNVIATTQIVREYCYSSGVKGGVFPDTYSYSSTSTNDLTNNDDIYMESISFGKPWQPFPPPTIYKATQIGFVLYVYAVNISGGASTSKVTANISANPQALIAVNR